MAKISEKKTDESIKTEDDDEDEDFFFNDYKDNNDDNSLNSRSIMGDSRMETPNVHSAKKTNIKEHLLNQDVALTQERYVEYDGYRMPINLNNPWAIGKVLNQTKGKLSLKELKSSAKNSSKISAQAKEAIFLQRVNELQEEERKNQLKWQVKLGESPVDPEIREDILISRAKAEYEYKVKFLFTVLINTINKLK